MSDRTSEDPSQLAKVLGMFSFDVDDETIIFNQKDKSKQAIVNSISQLSGMPEQAITVDMRVESRQNSSFIAIWRNSTSTTSGDSEGTIRVNFTVVCETDKAGEMVNLLDTANTTSLGALIASGLAAKGVGDPHVHMRVSVQDSIEAQVSSGTDGESDLNMNTDDADQETKENEEAAADNAATSEDQPSVLEGKMMLKVENVSEFEESGEAQDGVSKEIAFAADVAEDWVAATFKGMPTQKEVEVDFTITLTNESKLTADQVVANISRSGDDKHVIEEKLTTLFEGRGLNPNVSIITFCIIGHSCDTPPTGETTTDETAATAAIGDNADEEQKAADSSEKDEAEAHEKAEEDFADTPPDEQTDEIAQAQAEASQQDELAKEKEQDEIAQEKGEGSDAKDSGILKYPWIPNDIRDTMGYPKVSQEVYGFDDSILTTNPMNTWTSTTSFIPLDKFDGELDLKIGDCDAFANQVVLQTCVCNAFAGLVDVPHSDVLCKFEITADADSLSVVQTLPSGSMIVKFSLDVPDARRSEVEQNLRNMDMAILQVNITDAISNAGYQPDPLGVEVSTLFVSQVDINVAAPAETARADFKEPWEFGAIDEDFANSTETNPAIEVQNTITTGTTSAAPTSNGTISAASTNTST
jgi:hypothetical protein